MRRRPTVRFWFTLYAFLAFTAVATPGQAAATAVASAGDASISHNESAGTWTLSAAGTSLTLTLDAGRDFAVERLATSSGTTWTRSVAADSIVKVGTQVLALGARSAGFVLRDVTVDTTDRRLQLNAIFDLEAAGLRVARHYAIVSGSPSFEAWNTYSPLRGAPQLSDLDALQIVVTSGNVRTLTGLTGDNADVESDAAFTLQQRTATATTPLTIGAQGRASESWVPWLAIDGARDEFYMALMWSGAWSISGTRTGPGLSLSAGLASMTTTITAVVDGPHVVFGAVAGGLSEATGALRSYVLDGVRAGQALTPLVTYNTWFAYGTTVDEPSMLSEMDAAAALGAELFVLDAGWYPGAGAAGPFDFDAGLGSWTADPARFPNGLRPLRDHAHDLGIKFGVWVEPERVNLSLVGDPGPDESWLATAGGAYGSDHSALICLSNAAARKWILDGLTQLINEVQPDYLKWDNNMWVNCDRDGHEHGKLDGNFAQVNGLYDALATLRQQYPDLLIENVSGGGNRLDVGMLRYSDTAWMDDRTAPSAHVRHNLEGLGTVFPPAYLLSFVTEHDGESLHNPLDLSLYMRSRMAGVLGLCFKSAEYSEGESAGMSHEVAIYKGIRDAMSSAAATLLTPQARQSNGPAWDVAQTATVGNGEEVVWAYQSDDGVDRVNVKPVGLDPKSTYQVESVDTGALGEATGSDLMTNGIDVLQSPNTAAHVLILTTKQ
ncbi:MAG TPA: glycoside hydrolase family 36 protein [Vicinamibacterales bacterium]|nr:glycoside hydrolase family 36 protein [Vicinamibacterales bacterium]